MGELIICVVPCVLPKEPPDELLSVGLFRLDAVVAFVDDVADSVVCLGRQFASIKHAASSCIFWSFGGAAIEELANGSVCAAAGVLNVGMIVDGILVISLSAGGSLWALVQAPTATTIKSIGHFVVCDIKNPLRLSFSKVITCLSHAMWSTVSIDIN